jgi:integrase
MGKSRYLSELFRDMIWPAYSMGLRSKAIKELYLAFVREICDYVHKSFENITYNDALRFFTDLKNGTITYGNGLRYESSSIYLRWCALRSISSFVLYRVSDFGLKDYEAPFARIAVDAPAFEITSEQIPVKKEIEGLMDKCKGGYSYMRYVIGLAFYCGLTVSEIANLKRTDLYAFGPCKSVLAGSGRTRRTVPIPEPFGTELVCYVSEHRGDTDSLFASKRKAPLDARNMQRGLKSLGTEWTLSSIRNAAGCLMLSQDWNHKDTAAFLGVTERNVYRFEPAAEDLRLFAD